MIIKLLNLNVILWVDNSECITNFRKSEVTVFHSNETERDLSWVIHKRLDHGSSSRIKEIFH